jgi:membrane fusion protein, copper/silver efflux system
MKHSRRLFPVVAGFTVLLAGIGGGYCAGRGTGRPPTISVRPTGAQQVWTCSMHPQVRLPGPGKCPICEMPLISAGSGAVTADTPTIELSPHAIAMASVETELVARRALVRELLTVGKIEFDESSLATITPRVDGYAEKLFVNFTGVSIKKGDHLAEVYSPELLVAQQELLIALQGGVEGPLVDTAKTKLELLGLTPDQVATLVVARQITRHITLYSPITGTVIEKLVVQNAAFRAGDSLYRIANLETVWAYVDIYEYDLPWVRYGQRVAITAEAVPGVEFAGTVTFVQPIVTETTRTIRVPVHVANTDLKLKPGMFVSVVIRAALGANGEPLPTGVEGRFACPMHPQVIHDEPGPCSVCGMPLEKVPGMPATVEPKAAPTRFVCPMHCEKDKTYEQPGKCPVCEMPLEPTKPVLPADGPLAVPVTAVLDSGIRKLVYVEKGRGTYEPRVVTLGPRAGDFFPVRTGLADSERVVTRGNFLIDSQFQVTGHPSLLHPGGSHATMGHRHGSGAPPAEPLPSPAKANEHSGHGR